MIAKRPLEYVCFSPVVLPTKEGEVFFYASIDSFSSFLFNTGIEGNDDQETVLKHIHLLTEHPDFVTHIDKGFTLVLHKYKELEPRISKIVNPINGKVVFDGQYVNRRMAPVIKNLLQGFGQ